MKPGVYENIAYEEYDAIPAYRSHDLTTIKCPYSWKNRKAQLKHLLYLRAEYNIPCSWKRNFDKEFDSAKHR